MLTVDFAFEAIRKRLGVDATANWYSLHPPTSIPIRDYVSEADLPFHVQPLTKHLEQIYEHDAVIFWGDFLHTRHYMEQDAVARLLKFGLASDPAAARQLLYRSLLLRDAPDELLSRTVLYGGTILHNSQGDYADDGYEAAFTRIMRRSRAVWMREPLSAAKVGHLRQHDDLARFGVDAALLLRPGDLDDLPSTDWADSIPKDEVAGVFFGRRTEIPSWLPSLCQRLADSLDTRLEWLPWFDIPPSSSLRIDTRMGRPTIGDILASLPKYKFVITDTYHLCVNSWRSGTPAICIGSPQPDDSSAAGLLSLNDLKKHVFHLAYDAPDFYISTARDTSSQGKDSLQNLMELLQGGFKPVAHRMREHAERSEEALIQTLTSILHRP